MTADLNSSSVYMLYMCLTLLDWDSCLAQLRDSRLLRWQPSTLSYGGSMQQGAQAEVHVHGTGQSSLCLQGTDHQTLPLTCIGPM